MPKSVSPINIAAIHSEVKSSSTDRVRKKDLGQFFTPVEISVFMSQLFSLKSTVTKLEILDPGFGTLQLTTAVIENIVSTWSNITEINITGFEIDESLKLENSKTKRKIINWGKKREIDIKLNLIYSDFIKADLEDQKFHLIICNPPYFKVNSNDLRLTYFEEELLGQQNIYGLFLLKSSACLHQNGQLIFIVPRSITSGIYFESIRNILLKRLKINQVHIFKSRKDSFTKDKVLQENIIIHAELLASKKSDSIIISQTTGINDFDEIKVKVHNQSRIIKRLGRSNIIHLPTNSDEEEAMEIIKDWKHNLSDFNLQVSTGPVVAYRATKFSSNFKRKNSVPLLWLHNCNQFKIDWPKKFKDKPQWISTNKVSDSKTIANKNYVLIRRTTSKESPTLVQASAFHKNEFEFDEIGIENHLNYIHRKDGFISDNVILGLTAFYNSVIFDLYFRTVCGSTQINATDLNNISIPDIELIRELGSQLANCEKINRETSENIINSVIGVELTI